MAKHINHAEYKPPSKVQIAAEEGKYRAEGMVRDVLMNSPKVKKQVKHVMATMKKTEKHIMQSMREM